MSTSDPKPPKGRTSNLVTYRSALLTVFDHVCGQIDPLIDRQMKSVEKKGHVVTVSLEFEPPINTPTTLSTKVNNDISTNEL